MGFAAAEPADVPGGAEGAAAAVVVGAAGMDGEGVPFAAPADGDGDDAVAVTLAACLEPKMADTILPKTLIFSSLRSPLQGKHRLSASRHPSEGRLLDVGSSQLTRAVSCRMRLSSVKSETAL